jgi:4-carboxymuconolactone decarboxylase
MRANTDLKMTSRTLMVALAVALLVGKPALAAPDAPPPSAKPEMRIPVLRLDAMTPEQQEASDTLQDAFGVTFKDRTPAGPLGSAIVDPGFGKPMAMMFKHFHRDPAVDQRLFELVVLTTARTWNAQFEWYAHEGPALKAGLSKTVVEALRFGQPPAFGRDDEKAVYAMTREVLGRRKLSQATFDQAVQQVGRDAAVKYLFAAAYYDATSVVVVGLDMQMPPGLPDPLPPLPQTAAR